MSLKVILNNFLNLVENNEIKKKSGEDIYELEFQKLKTLTDKLKNDPEYTCSHGAKEVNRCKNRYKDILPYDYTRVILTEDPDILGSDYTNANYIKGATNSPAYIASQGPLPNTVVDFWRMIWECEVKVVIMACNERESGKQKCECYWPENEAQHYGNILIETLKTQSVCPDFLVRTLKVSCNETERRIYQFHYTTWPDHGVPDTVQPILHLIQLVRKFQASDAVPILVHCSAGCGRTGTICSIDYVWRLMKMGKLKESFSLFEIISAMRRQRIAMVQTKEQYILVHRAVASLFEYQLELINNHIYENLDKNGQPLLLEEDENKLEEMSDLHWENTSYSHQDDDTDVRQKNNCADTDVEKSYSSNQKNELKEIINTSLTERLFDHESASETLIKSEDYEQNINVTISLPLTLCKKSSDNFSVSTTLKYDNDKLIIDSHDRTVYDTTVDDNENLEIPKANNIFQPGLCADTNKISSACNYSPSPQDNTDKLCEKKENTSSFSNKENSEINTVYNNTESNNLTDTKAKLADIEKIFLRILGDKNSTNYEEENRNVLTENNNLSKQNEKVGVSQLSSNLSLNNKLDNTEKQFSSAYKMNNNTVCDLNTAMTLNTLTDNTTLASRKRYMCLVSECEQSFSEIERLLEEKDMKNKNESKLKEEITSESQNQKVLSKITDIEKDHNSAVMQDIEIYHSMEDNENDKIQPEICEQTKKLELNSNLHEKKVDTQLTHENKCNSELIASTDIGYANKDKTLNQNSRQVKDTQNVIGIEQALRKNCLGSDVIQFIDTGSQESFVEEQFSHNEQSFCTKNLSDNKNTHPGVDEKSNVFCSNKSSPLSVYRNKNSSPPATSVKQEVKTDISDKRTGKIFESDQIFTDLKPERSSSICVSSFYLPTGKKCEEDVFCSDKDRKDCTNDTCAASKDCETKDSTDVETTNGKAVVQRPSIAKLKALFEKSVAADVQLSKHKQKRPLGRSQSHHVSRNKSLPSNVSKVHHDERNVIKATLFDKVSKIFHSPNDEQLPNNELNAYWKSAEAGKVSFTPIITSNVVQSPTEKEKKSLWYDVPKKKDQESSCIPLNSENRPKVNEPQNESVENSDSAIGCLDISSLISVVSKDQTNQTQWYEQASQISSVPENTKVYAKETENTNKKFSDTEVSHDNLDDTIKSNQAPHAKPTLPPEIPIKKKNQNSSFHSYLEQKEASNDLVFNKPEIKTKWYYEKDEENIENDNKDYNSSYVLDARKIEEPIVDNEQETDVRSTFCNLVPQETATSCRDITEEQPPLPPKKKVDKQNSNSNWYLKDKLNSDDTENEFLKDSSQHWAYVNVIKTKDGMLIGNDNEQKKVPYISTKVKSDLYMNVNLTTKKNIEQIESSLQQHPRGAIIDLTSRQSYANEQQQMNSSRESKTIEQDVKSAEESPKLDLLNPSKKLKDEKDYETIWPIKDDSVNIMDTNNSHISNSKVSNDKQKHKEEEILAVTHKQLDENRVKPQPKSKPMAAEISLSKSKSSSALFSKSQKQVDKKNSNEDANRFKERSVNKVVCELNSILSVLTTRPFKFSKSEITSTTENTSVPKVDEQHKTKVCHPSAPPRRKPKQDIPDHLLHSSRSTVNPYQSVPQYYNNPSEPNVWQLSKSATLPNFNNAQSKEIKINEKEIVAESADSHHFKNSKKLDPVRENLDYIQRDNALTTKKEPDYEHQRTMHKLNHSTSDASIFSGLRKTKYLSKNKSQINNVSCQSEVKEKSHTLSNPSPSELSKTKDYGVIIQNRSNTVLQAENETSKVKKNERRSMDDMDAFPVAPPRSKRHGPTLKSVLEMEKFTKSLDEVVSKPVTSSVWNLKSSDLPIKQLSKGSYVNIHALLSSNLNNACQSSAVTVPTDISLEEGKSSHEAEVTNHIPMQTKSLKNFPVLKKPVLPPSASAKLFSNKELRDDDIRTVRTKAKSRQQPKLPQDYKHQENL